MNVSGDFKDVVIPHLPAAHRLARWLTRNRDDAQDIVQEASLRAFRHFHQFQGGDAHAWFLTIVRNTCYGWDRKHRRGTRTEPVDWMLEGEPQDQDGRDPEELLLQRADSRLVGQAIAALPTRFRSVFVLRELEGLTYAEIAEALRMPIGTVMSSLSRARDHFRRTIRP